MVFSADDDAHTGIASGSALFIAMNERLIITEFCMRVDRGNMLLVAVLTTTRSCTCLPSIIDTRIITAYCASLFPMSNVDVLKLVYGCERDCSIRSDPIPCIYEIQER